MPVQPLRRSARPALHDVVRECALVEDGEVTGVVEAGQAVAQQDLGLERHGGALSVAGARSIRDAVEAPLGHRAPPTTLER